MRNSTRYLFLYWSLLAVSLSASAEPVSITTFNIEWYGAADAASRQKQDARNQSIREFLALSGVDADVYAFEEILDVGELSTNLLGSRYACHSYNPDNRGHQHVVICHKNTYRFRVGNNDDNYIWEDVAMGTLRPAVHGILSNSSGRDLAHIIAVHLKAMPDQGARRLEQTRLIANNILTRGDNLPVVMLGDFNTYTDEIDQITRAFNQSGVSFTPVDVAFEFTYRTARYSNKFDWLLATDGVGVLKEAAVDGPCNSSWRSGTSFDDLTYYNEKVSDHCPVSVILDL